MKKETFTCIGCPIGCTLDVTMIDEDNIIVEGNQCSIGDVVVKNVLGSDVNMIATSEVLKK